MSKFATPEIKMLRSCWASWGALSAEGEENDTRHYDVTENGGAVRMCERIRTLCLPWNLEDQTRHYCTAYYGKCRYRYNWLLLELSTLYCTGIGMVQCNMCSMRNNTALLYTTCSCATFEILVLFRHKSFHKRMHVYQKQRAMQKL
jgi:hypothetical protein